MSPAQPDPPSRLPPAGDGTGPEPDREGQIVRCPFCLYRDSRVVDSREADEGAAIRRRRACPRCGRRFTTVETAAFVVVKRSGVREPFSRSKVLDGVAKACQGRPVDADDLAVLAQVVEETVRGQGAAEVSSQDVGRAVLAPLRRLDEVAYLRFASVYRSFECLADFEAEIAALRREGGAEPPGRPGAPPGTARVAAPEPVAATGTG